MHQIRAWTQGPSHFKEFSEGLLLERGEVSRVDGRPWEEDRELGAGPPVVWFVTSLCSNFTLIQ